MEKRCWTPHLDTDAFERAYEQALAICASPDTVIPLQPERAQLLRDARRSLDPSLLLSVAVFQTYPNVIPGNWSSAGGASARLLTFLQLVQDGKLPRDEIFDDGRIRKPWLHAVAKTPFDLNRHEFRVDKLQELARKFQDRLERDANKAE